MKQKATHFNLEQFVGDVHQSHQIGPSILSLPGYRLIKSHEEFNVSYRHVIYLVRNPISVMVSYYAFLQGRIGYQGTFSDFIKDERYGAMAWNRHVESWLGVDRSIKIHIQRYEDLKDDTYKEMRTLFNNLGVLISEKTIRESVEMSSFENMKEDNVLFLKKCPVRNYKFVRKGEKNYDIHDEDKSYILKNTRGLIKKYYPELVE